jgi:hypothetical protein
VLTTVGDNGTVRSLASVLVRPIARLRSARCLTCRWRFVKSTSVQRSPRSSDERRPVKIAVSRRGRHLLPSFERADEGFDLGWSRYVYAHLEAPPTPILLVFGSLSAATPTFAQLSHGVPSDRAALLRVSQEGPQAAEDVSRERRGASPFP